MTQSPSYPAPDPVWDCPVWSNGPVWANPVWAESPAHSDQCSSAKAGPTAAPSWLQTTLEDIHTAAISSTAKDKLSYAALLAARETKTKDMHYHVAQSQHTVKPSIPADSNTVASVFGSLAQFVWDVKDITSTATGLTADDLHPLLLHCRRHNV